MQPFNKSNSCGAVRPLLWEYAAGTLSADPELSARIERHLTHCPKCRAELEAFRASASAMAVYTSAPETGIPPRAPNWEAIQSRLEQTERQEVNPISGLSWLRAMRTSPAFVGATISLGLCTTICAAAIPWAINNDARQTQGLENRGAAALGVSTSATVEPSRSAAEAPVEMVVRPVFESIWSGAPARSPYPLAATLVNHTGRETTVHLSVLSSGTSPAYRSERSVRLAASSQPQRFVLYPSIGNDFNPAPELRISLVGAFPQQTAIIPYRIFSNEVKRLALIGDAGYGSLIPKQQVIEQHRRAIRQRTHSNPGTAASVYNVPYACLSAKPETAPDRTVGYDSINTLVLGQGAERLNTAQRGAIRQWVIGGGSVIVLPGAGLGLLDIAPHAPFEPVHLFGVVPNSQGVQYDPRIVRDDPVLRLLPPETPLHRYALGMGTVLTVGADLTLPEYREKWELPFVWNELQTRAASPIRATDISPAGAYGIAAGAYAYGQGAQSSDPFQIALPPLASLVYLFAGYFVLAVPVTFVVLKQTGRMNWAWATGPILAAVFGGAVYGFTADLHRATLSRRTSGLIISTAGEKQARFSGCSELFFPSAGRYDVSVPGAETVQLDLSSVNPNQASTNTDSSENRQTQGSEGGGIIPRSLETVDNGTSVSVPDFSVPNLAFRRLNHTQPVTWGKGISTDLHTLRDGRIVGTIQNDTGRTLQNAFILLPTPEITTEVTNHKSYQRHFDRILVVDNIMPGLNKMNVTTTIMNMDNKAPDTPWAEGEFPGVRESIYDLWMNYRFSPQDRGHYRAAPILVATTSGEKLGPTIGQYVGGQNTVTVAVTLTPIQKADNSVVQGGAK